MLPDVTRVIKWQSGLWTRTGSPPRPVHLLPPCDWQSPSLTFLTLAVYCFMAIFSKALSKPKKDRMSSEADCSKQVQSSFSGWTWKPGRDDNTVSGWRMPCPPSGFSRWPGHSQSMQWTAHPSWQHPRVPAIPTGPTQSTIQGIKC